ncbi:MAG: hypothetical protein LBL62_03665 [Planctomycetaceae bacterium]|nr:hypothetical protein [Planctomycetaceae bacterium]
MRNNPPQRGGLRHVNKFALKGQWISGEWIVDSGELSYDSACVPNYNIHCPFRAIVRRGLPTALRWVVMQCP